MSYQIIRINIIAKSWRSRKEVQDNMTGFTIAGTRSEVLGWLAVNRECEACGRLHDVTTEPSEVKQSGMYICADCWDRKK
jgi:N-acetylglutamate synthase-like GNAT family acetyltransferase